MTFPKIYLAAVIQKSFEKFRTSGSKVSSCFFQNNESSGYITYYISLESISFTDFKKKGIGNSNYFKKAVIYQEMTSLILSVQKSHVYVRL